MSAKVRRKRTRKNARTKQRVPRAIAAPALKYFDFYTTGVSSTTFASAIVSAVPQGVGQSHRLVDTVLLKRMDVRMYFVSSTSDETNVIRISLFHWIPNTSALLPGATSYYEDPSSFGVRTPLNFEGRRDYRTIFDRAISLIGTNTSLTNGYTKQYNTSINLKGRIDFNLGLSTGYNHIFITHFSDSAITPFPSVTAQIRLWYTDTVN
jgi:hypothetical protein